MKYPYTVIYKADSEETEEGILTTSVLRMSHKRFKTAKLAQEYADSIAPCRFAQVIDLEYFYLEGFKADFNQLSKFI